MFVPVSVSVEENPYPMEALCCETDQSQSKQPVMGGPGRPLGRVPSPSQGAWLQGPWEQRLAAPLPCVQKVCWKGSPLPLG